MKTEASIKSASRFCSSIEALEARVAPAVVIPNAHTATYTDVDGDRVTIKVSKGEFSDDNFVSTPDGVGDQLLAIDLREGGFDRANLTISVKKAPGGDGLAHIGHIDSTGHDLGVVNLKGDLGRIDVGDENTANGALKKLQVHSIGRFGLDTQGEDGSLTSNIVGKLGNLSVKRSVIEAIINITGGAAGQLGSANIGGSLIGGTETDSGSIHTSGKMGPVKIMGDVVGGEGEGSGQISGNGLGQVTVRGDLVGGTGIESGFIASERNLAGVRIGGTVIEGPDSTSGAISSGGKIGFVTVGGDLVAGRIPGAAARNVSDFITNPSQVPGAFTGNNTFDNFDFLTPQDFIDAGSPVVAGGVGGGFSTGSTNNFNDNDADNDGINDNNEFPTFIVAGTF